MTVYLNTVMKVAKNEPPAVPLYVQSQENWQRRISTAVNGLQGYDPLPIGACVGWPPSVNAPAGYLLCDGTELNQTDYPALYAVIGQTFGGNAGTFLLPDLRGTAPVMQPTPPAQDISGGAVVSTTTTGTSGAGTNITTGGRIDPTRDPLGTIVVNVQ